MREATREDGVRIVSLNLRMDRDAYELLRELAPGKRTHGRFLSRLVYEHAVRLEERERVTQGAEVPGE